MALEPWYKVVLPRREVREGRSFNPDEFAIALEQVVAGTAPADYRDPEAFFDRTCFTRALRDHTGMVLRRLAGETAHTAPVMTLVTQFGGGKTHTLTALYHLVTASDRIGDREEVRSLLHEAALSAAPAARVAVFVGNAWDPREGREAPWVDVARQLAGDEGVALLGAQAASTPPGTEALGRVFAAAGAPVLVLFDEVLNFVNRYRQMADPFHAFIQNLTVAMTGTTRGAAPTRTCGGRWRRCRPRTEPSSKAVSSSRRGTSSVATRRRRPASRALGARSRRSTASRCACGRTRPTAERTREPRSPHTGKP